MNVPYIKPLDLSFFCEAIRVRVNLNELALNLSKDLCQIVAKQPKNLSQQKRFFLTRA
jgi:5-bromo-4-chloroindolyl phosphate hydrolysis protein